MKKLKLNYAAIIVVVVVSQVIPMLWYSLFTDAWLAMNDLTMEEAEAGASASPYITAIVSSFVFAWVLAWLFKRMKVESARDGLFTAVVMGIPFSLLNLMTIYMFSFRPYGLAWIDGGENVLIWAVAGLILGAWRKYDDV